MYGRLGSMTTQPGKRAPLVELLLRYYSGSPGCLNFVVAIDPVDETTVWTHEVWETAGHQRAAMVHPQRQAEIAEFKSLIASFGLSRELRVMGGNGLPPALEKEDPRSAG